MWLCYRSEIILYLPLSCLTTWLNMTRERRRGFNCSQQQQELFALCVSIDKLIYSDWFVSLLVFSASFYSRPIWFFHDILQPRHTKGSQAMPALCYCFSTGTIKEVVDLVGVLEVCWFAEKALHLTAHCGRFCLHYVVFKTDLFTNLFKLCHNKNFPLICQSKVFNVKWQQEEMFSLH